MYAGGGLRLVSRLVSRLVLASWLGFVAVVRGYGSGFITRGNTLAMRGQGDQRKQVMT